MTKASKETTDIPDNRLRDLRIAGGWTLNAVAMLVGIDESLVSMHERGKRRLTSATVELYMTLYRVGPLEIFHTIVTETKTASED